MKSRYTTTTTLSFISIQDLKKQTAMRLAHEQQQMMVPGNANNTNNSSSVSGGLSLHPNPNHPQGRSSMNTHNNNVVMNSYNTNYQSGVPMRFVPNNVMASPNNNNNKHHHYNNNTSMLYPQQGVVAASSVPHHHHQESHSVLNDYRDLRERNQQQVLQHNKPSMIYSNNNNNLQHHHPPSSSIGSSYSHSQYGVPDVMSETSSIRSSAFDETSFTNNNNNNVSSQHNQNQYTNTTNESSSGNNYHNIHSNHSTPTFHRHTSSSEGYNHNPHHNQHIRQVMKSNPSLESVSSLRSISSKGSNSRRQNSRNKNNKEVMDTNNSSGDQVLMQAHSNLSSSSSRHPNPNHHVHHVHPMQQQQYAGNNMNQPTDSLQQQGQHHPKLPHGLTVHELKEMTRARLAVERNKPPAESTSTKEEGERGVPEMIQKTYTEDTTGSSDNIWQRTTTTTSTGTNIKNTRHLQHTFSSSGGNSVGQHGSPVRQQHQQLLPSSQSSTTVDSLLGKFVKPSNSDCGGSSAAPVVVYNRPHLNSVDSGSVTSYNTLGSEYLASDSASLSFLGGGSSSNRNYNQFSENHPNNQDDENFLFRSYSYPSNTNNNINSTTDLLLDHSQYPEEISKSRSFFEPSSSNTPSRRRLGSSPPGFKVAHEDRPLLRSVAEDLVEIPGLSLDRTIRHRGCTSTSNSGNLMNDEVSSHKSQGSCSVFSESTNFTKNTSSHHQHHHNDYASGILASVKSMPDDLENLTSNSTSLLSNEALHHSRNASLSGLNDLPNWVAESVLNTVGDEVRSTSVEETFMDKSDKKNGADAVFRNTYSSPMGSFSNYAGGVPSSTSNNNLGNNYININNNNSNNASSGGFLYPGLGMSECGSTGSFCGSASAVSDLFSGNLGILSFGGVGEPPTTTSTGEQEDHHHHHHDTPGAILQTSNTFPLISSSFISARYNSAGHDLFNSNSSNNNDIMDPPVVLAPLPPVVSNKFLNSNDRVSVSNMGVDLVETLRNTHLSTATATTNNNNDNDRPSTAGSTLSSSSTNSQSQTNRHPKQQHRRNRGPNSRRRQRINRSNHRKGTSTTTDTNTSRTNQNNQHWK